MKPVSSLLVAGVAVACSQTPSDVREWRASDHDHQDNPALGQTDVSDGGQTGVMGIDEVALAAWRANCVPCHGLIGRGDGPRGIPLKTRDLTDPAWQRSTTDEQIAAAILNGKGQMPRFELPPATVQQLVRLVRLLAPRTSPPPGSSVDATDAGRPPAADAGAATAAGRAARSPGDAGTPATTDAGTAPARAPGP